MGTNIQTCVDYIRQCMRTCITYSRTLHTCILTYITHNACKHTLSKCTYRFTDD